MSVPGTALAERNGDVSSTAPRRKGSGMQSPPAIVRALHADERAFARTHDARFARDRQVLIRSLGRRPRALAAVLRLAPGERDDLLARRDLQRLAASSPPLTARIRVGAPPPETR